MFLCRTYAHHLLEIEEEFSDFYRCMITNVGYNGIKPGWVRLNLHYILDEEIDFVEFETEPDNLIYFYANRVKNDNCCQ